MKLKEKEYYWDGSGEIIQVLSIDRLTDPKVVAQTLMGEICFYDLEGFEAFNVHENDLMYKVFKSGDIWRHKQSGRTITLNKHHNKETRNTWDLKDNSYPCVSERELVTEWKLVTELVITKPNKPKEDVVEVGDKWRLIADEHVTIMIIRVDHDSCFNCDYSFDDKSEVVVVKHTKSELLNMYEKID